MKVFSKNVKNVADVFVTTSVSLSLSADEIGVVALALSELSVSASSNTDAVRVDLLNQFNSL